jgi:plastocyanin
MPHNVLRRAIVPCALIAVVGGLTMGVAVAAGGEKRAAAPLTQVSYVESDFKIAPSTVTLKKGTPTKITVANRGTTQHTFTSKKLGINMVLDPDETAEVTVKNKKAGTFTAMCTIHTSMKTKIKIK